MSFPGHIDNKKKDILVLGTGPTQGLEHTWTAEKNVLDYFFYDKKEILFKFAL